MIQSIVDFLWPHACIGCKAIHVDEDTLCSACFQKLHVLSAPQCFRCAHPLLDNNDLSDEGCSYCPPRFQIDETRCSLSYQGLGSQLINRLKKTDALHVAYFLAQFMQRAHQSADMWNQPSFILAPVPISWWRLACRGYNQSVEIGRHLQHINGVEWIPDLLKTCGQHVDQKAQDAHDRFKNPPLFELNPKYNVKNKTIWILDDVMTTGVTMSSCAKTLKKKGARFVGALVATRALRLD